MANPAMNIMMNMLRNRNPQAFNSINQAMQMGTDPRGFVKQFVSKATPEQMQSVMQQAQQMGVSPEILKNLQNLK